MTLYEPTTWNLGAAPGISATLLNKIENGIRGAMPVGSVISSFQDAAPTGFLKLDGATVARATYPELWDYIVAQNLDDGAPFGNGDGSTTFLLPDCRQRFPRMPASGAGDGQGGSDTHNHTGPNHTHTGPSHTHTGPSHTHDEGVTGPAIPGVDTGSQGLYEGAGTRDQHTHDEGVTAAGGTGATGAGGTGNTGASGTGNTGSGSNVPAYFEINFFIAT